MTVTFYTLGSLVTMQHWTGEPRGFTFYINVLQHDSKNFRPRLTHNVYKMMVVTFLNYSSGKSHCAFRYNGPLRKYCIS